MKTTWPTYQSTLAETGSVLIPPILSPDACRELAALYDVPGPYRKTIVMQPDRANL